MPRKTPEPRLITNSTLLSAQEHTLVVTGKRTRVTLTEGSDVTNLIVLNGAHVQIDHTKVRKVTITPGSSVEASWGARVGTAIVHDHAVLFGTGITGEPSDYTRITTVLAHPRSNLRLEYARVSNLYLDNAYLRRGVGYEEGPVVCGKYENDKAWFLDATTPGYQEHDIDWYREWADTGVKPDRRPVAPTKTPIYATRAFSDEVLDKGAEAAARKAARDEAKARVDAAEKARQEAEEARRAYQRPLTNAMNSIVRAEDANIRNGHGPFTEEQWLKFTGGQYKHRPADQPKAPLAPATVNAKKHTRKVSTAAPEAPVEAVEAVENAPAPAPVAVEVAEAEEVPSEPVTPAVDTPAAPVDNDATNTDRKDTHNMPTADTDTTAPAEHDYTPPAPKGPAGARRAATIVRNEVTIITSGDLPPDDNAPNGYGYIQQTRDPHDGTPHNHILPVDEAAAVIIHDTPEATIIVPEDADPTVDRLIIVPPGVGFRETTRVHIQAPADFDTRRLAIAAHQLVALNGAIIWQQNGTSGIPHDYLAQNLACIRRTALLEEPHYRYLLTAAVDNLLDEIFERNPPTQRVLKALNGLYRLGDIEGSVASVRYKSGAYHLDVEGAPEGVVPAEYPLDDSWVYESLPDGRDMMLLEAPADHEKAGKHLALVGVSMHPGDAPMLNDEHLLHIHQAAWVQYRDPSETSTAV